MTSPTTTSESVVTLGDAPFSYGSSTVLTGVTGRVPIGRAFALIGPNDSGKTTPIWALLGMVTVSRGRVRVSEAAPDRAPQGSVGYAPQLNDLDPTFPVTVRGMVQVGMYPQLGILWRPGTETRRWALEALGGVGLVDRAERRSGTLPGGQQQRALVACRAAVQPRLILLDEPFNDLDQPNRKALLSIITSLRDQGISLAISTYNPVLTQETYEQAALLVGRQIAFDPRDDVLVARYINEVYDGRGTTRLSGLRFGASTQEPS